MRQPWEPALPAPRASKIPTMLAIHEADDHAAKTIHCWGRRGWSFDDCRFGNENYQGCQRLHRHFSREVGDSGGENGHAFVPWPKILGRRRVQEMGSWLVTHKLHTGSQGVPLPNHKKFQGAFPEAKIDLWIDDASFDVVADSAA